MLWIFLLPVILAFVYIAVHYESDVTEKPSAAKEANKQFNMKINMFL